MPDHRAPAHDSPSPDVTVVVPTRNAARTLAACLQSLRAQTYPCRTVVVDNGSTDATVAIAEQGADVVLHAGPERSAQRNHGARSHPASIVGFIDADMVLAPTVVEEAVNAIGHGAGSVIVPERTVGSGFWVEVRAFERSFYNGSDAIEAARFFRWDVFERAGGFDEQLTGAEDWDLGESARQLAPVTRTTAVIDHHEGTIFYLDACRKKAYYAEGVRRYVAKRGVSALRQASQRPWLHQPRKLMNRRGAGLVALKAGEAVAVLAALAHGRAGLLRTPEMEIGRRAVGHRPGDGIRCHRRLGLRSRLDPRRLVRRTSEWLVLSTAKLDCHRRASPNSRKLPGATHARLRRWYPHWLSPHRILSHDVLGDHDSR